METIALIFVKTTAAITLFSLFYWTVLKRFTFYQINRAYLLFAINFSLIYPFIQISQSYLQKVTIFPNELNIQLPPPQSFSVKTWWYISAIWVLGVIYFLGKFIIRFISLWNLHRKSNPSNLSKNIRLVGYKISPFSFGKFIYINPSLHSSDELEAVLLHETIHVKQKHSIDILIVEILILFHWMNPFVWLIKKAIKENIEFITDQEVINKGINKKEYQYFLLNVAQQIPILQQHANFNIADLKKRIKQMNMKKTSTLKLSLYLIIPILAIGLIWLNQTKEEEVLLSNNLEKIIINKPKDYTYTPPKENAKTTPKSKSKKKTIDDINVADIKGIVLDKETNKVYVQIDENGKDINIPLTDEDLKKIKFRGSATPPEKKDQETITVEGYPSSSNKQISDAKDENKPIVVRGYKVEKKENTIQDPIIVEGYPSSSKRKSEEPIDENNPIVVKGHKIENKDHQEKKEQQEQP